MTTTATPAAAPEKNKIGFSKSEYQGSKSTLCVGCGHDQITNHIITACYQSDVNPYELLKMSGIGCSSKTPAYFMSKSFGFNSLHGRMAPVSTGAHVVLPNYFMLGVSGDGDTASIGLSGFCHLVRRNLPMVYLVANNGVYGLTKGQFSATADAGSQLKTGEKNPFESIDLCSLAIDLGCTFVARSFSGDAKQLVPLIKAALRHRGTAFIDVISPCVTFNNHDGSTKSFGYLKEHDVVLQELGYIGAQESIEVDYQEGAREVVELHDGSKLTLKKLAANEHNPKDRKSAMDLLYAHRKTGEIVTGLFYVEENKESFTESLSLSDKSLAQMNESELRLTPEKFKELMAEFR